MFNTVVQPDMQATFGITIKPASQLQAHEYTAAMSIFYESDTELFASTFFNSTVLIQVPSLPPSARRRGRQVTPYRTRSARLSSRGHVSSPGQVLTSSQSLPYSLLCPTSPPPE